MKEVIALHENVEMDEMLALKTYTVKGEVLVNVRVWQEGKVLSIVAVPLKIFEHLVSSGKMV